MPRATVVVLALVFISMLPVIATAQTEPAGADTASGYAVQEKPSLDVERAAGSIIIDGSLDDPGWEGAARATGFSENFPEERGRPPVASEVLVTYDEENLYLGFVARDDPETIRTSIRDRDQMWQDDYFGILLDTYGDAAWAYFLFANPSGVQGDSRFSTAGDEDDGFDIVYTSEGRITDDGYVVEMAVPFESLRFPDRVEQTWRATFWRTRPRESRAQYTWAAMRRGDPCFLCQFGTLRGIQGVKPGGAIELLPSVVASQSSALKDEDDPDSGLESDGFEGDLSLGLRYAHPSGVTSEASLNPDFSQVESDVAQIDANETFALFFDERRPFFQEGSDLFGSYFDVVYTRQINDPDVAGKLIGRMGRTSVAYLGARDEHSPLLLPFQERSFVGQAGPSVSNIGRFRQTYGQSSYVGGLLTDRRYENGGGSGTTYGIDGVHRFLDKLQLEYQTLGSYTVEPDDPGETAELEGVTFDDGNHTARFDEESFSGVAQYLSFEKSGRRWFSDFDYWASSPTFRTDNGFEFQNDFQRLSVFEELNFYPESSWLDRFTADVFASREWTWDGVRKEDFIEPTIEMSLKAQTFIEFGPQWGRERFREIDFGGIRRWFLYVESNFSDPLRFWFFIDRGRAIARNEDPPVLGEGTDFEFAATIEPWQRVVIEPSLNYSDLETLEGEKLFEGYIFRTRTTFSFSRQLFLRLVLQYDDFDQQFNVEPLITYKINPFTLFYVGSTQVFEEFDEPGDPGYAQTERQYFAKFQYLFQL